jgi:hypothetical protein
MFNNERCFLQSLQSIADSIERISDKGIIIKIVYEREEVQDAAHGQKPDPVVPAMPKE